MDVTPRRAMLLVADRLREEAPELARVADRAIRLELERYSAVNEKSLRKSVGRNIDRVIKTLRTQEAPSRSTYGEAHSVTLERAVDGIPIEDIITAYRTSLTVIHDRLIELALAQRVPAEEILHSSQLIWQVGDWFTSMAARAYREFAVQDEVREKVHLAEMLRALLAGTLPPEKARAAATSLMIDPHSRYSAFCVTAPTSEAELRALEKMATPKALITSQGGSLVGLIKEGDQIPSNCLVGVGPISSIDEIAESARLAELILHLVGENEIGPYCIEDVTWRICASEQSIVDDVLHERYLRPMMELGEFGEIVIESVRMLLINNSDIKVTAEKLHIHHNTLRHRIGRFEEAVGSTLTNTNTVVELAWALRLPTPRQQDGAIGKNSNR